MLKRLVVLVAFISIAIPAAAWALDTTQNLAVGDNHTVHCAGNRVNVVPIDNNSVRNECRNITTSTTAPPTTTTTAPPTTTTAPPTTTTTQPPPTGGFPDASTTGVPAGTVLRTVPGQLTSGPGWEWRGWLQVTQPNTILDGLDVSGTIDVCNTCKNVTIKNSRVTVSGQSSIGILIRIQYGSPNVGGDGTLIDRVTIRGVNATSGRCMAGVQVQGGVKDTHVRAANIFWCGTGVQQDHGIIENSFIHDMGFLAGDHINGTTMNAGCCLTIRHNTILNQFGQTDAVSLFQDFGVISNVTIDNNLLAGGGYVIYGGAGGKGPTSNIKITNNRISTRFFPQGGQWGWLAAFNSGDPGNVASGNRWHESGQLIG